MSCNSGSRDQSKGEKTQVRELESDEEQEHEACWRLGDGRQQNANCWWTYPSYSALPQALGSGMRNTYVPFIVSIRVHCNANGTKSIVIMMKTLWKTLQILYLKGA